MARVAVTGALGFSGRHVTERLLDRGDVVLNLTNHPDRPDPFRGRVEARKLAFDRPDELAASLEVNPNTAARALQELADSGLARCERGTGYFVATEGPAIARTERQKLFFDEELPRLFKRMDALGIKLSEILERYSASGRTGA